jgi:hypothetical protein
MIKNIKMKKYIFVAVILIAIIYACTQSQQKNGAPAPPPISNSFCADSTNGNNLCSQLPFDVNETFQFGYTSILDSSFQPKFDIFSWQTFIALNWPADANGKPLPGPISSNTSAPRVWEFYNDPAQVFGNDDKAIMLKMTEAQAAGLKFVYAMSKSPHPLIKEFQEADGHPLIDRNLNFALYEIKINPVESNFIITNKLNTLKGIDSLAKANNGQFALPASDVTKIKEGSMELKAAWRILDPSQGDDTSRYYTRNAFIYMTGDNTVNGKPLIVKAKIGLVGLHIIRKTTLIPDFTWSTFEHVDNTPDNLQEAQVDQNKQWSFYNPKCLNCPVNYPPQFLPGDSGNYKWDTAPPYARRYAAAAPSQKVAGLFGTQVTRTFPVYSLTEQINKLWQAKLKGTVWANYRLIGTQWDKSDSPGNPPNAPALLANSVQETYIQNTASCISCHRFATVVITPGDTVVTDFSFLFGLAK